MYLYKSILSLTISSTDQEDKLIWRGTAKGLFSVRSAYHIEKGNETATQAGGSSQNRHSEVWRSIWRQNISNAEKHFLWRACHESLPTKANLCNRKVTRDPICTVCEREAETTFHVLWQCPAAQDTWSAGCRKFQKSCFAGPFFLPVVEGMLRVCDQQEFALFAGIARRLWLRRNALIHEGDFLHPNILVQQATQAVDSYISALEKTVLPTNVNAISSPSHWQNPPSGWVKANWDAGVNQRTGRVGLGVVIRDHHGKMWVAKSLTRLGFMDPRAAETLAASMAVKLGTEMGFRKIQLEGDAKVVVDIINSKQPDESDQGHLTEDLRIALRSLESWEMGYKGRECNTVAHVLASLALQNEMDRVWLYDPPACIREFLHAEALALQCMS